MGGLAGEVLGSGYKIVNGVERPKAPTPFGNVITNLKRMARMRAWETGQKQLDSRAALVNSITGSLYGNVLVQTWSAVNNWNNSIGADPFSLLNLQNSSGCAQTSASDSLGNSTGWSGCQ